MATEVDILMQQKLKNGDTKIMYPVTKMENVIVNRKEITLDTTWTNEAAPYTKTVEVEGIITENLVRIYPVWSDVLETRAQEREEYAKISKVDSQNGSILITCDEDKPTIALKIRLEVL